MAGADQTLAYLLDFDGEAIVYDGGYVARFRVERIRATLGRPHGVSYDGRRLMGYDNAHRVAHRGGRFVE